MRSRHEPGAGSRGAGRGLRIGVPRPLVQLAGSSGYGRMWTSVLPELAKLASVSVWDKPSRSRLRPPPDVWLHDGHGGPLGVPEPSVCHLQEAPWRHPSTRPLYRAKFIDQYEGPSRMAAEAAVRVLTPSESSRQQIIEQYDIDPAHVVKIPFGVNLAVFRPGRPGADDLLRRAGGDPRRPYVLFVSTVHPRKNLGSLRTAMAGLARRGLPHGLVVAASRPADRDDYQDLLDEAGSDLPGTTGRVVLLQDLTDMELAAIMAGATAFCLPSLWEGFGLTPLESMACGVPVVVSNCGSLPEVVGDAAVVTEPDADSLEQALFELLTDGARLAALARAGLERCLGFTWSATAEGWLRVLQDAVPEPGLSRFEWLPPTSGRVAQALTNGVRIPVQRRKWTQPVTPAPPGPSAPTAGAGGGCAEPPGPSAAPALPESPDVPGALEPRQPPATSEVAGHPPRSPVPSDGTRG